MLEIVACAALGAAAMSMPDYPDQVRNRAIACRQHFMDRLLAGETLRIGADTPTSERVAIREVYSLTKFARNDADGNGSLSLAEWWEAAWQSELLADVNRDGLVTREEFLGSRTSPREPSDAGLREFNGWMLRDHEQRFGRLSRDGRLSRERLGREVRADFRRNDLNRDGQVTGEERREAN